MSIPCFSSQTPAAEISEAFAEAGCAVVTDVTTSGLRQSIVDELSPHMSAVRVAKDDSPEDFYPGRTRRVPALIARSEAVTDSL